MRKKLLLLIAIFIASSFLLSLNLRAQDVIPLGSSDNITTILNNYVGGMSDVTLTIPQGYTNPQGTNTIDLSAIPTTITKLTLKGVGVQPNLNISLISLSTTTAFLKVKFDNLNIVGSKSGSYIFCPAAGSALSVDSMIFNNCTISNFNSAVRFQSTATPTPTQTINHLFVNNCIADNFLSTYAFVYINTTGGKIGTIDILKSTFYNFSTNVFNLPGNATISCNTINITNCTIDNILAATGNYFMDMSIANTSTVINITNTLFGRTITSAKGIRGGAITVTNSYKTSDWQTGTGSNISNITLYSGASTALFTSPSTGLGASATVGNYQIKDNTFAGAASRVGDPRWYNITISNAANASTSTLTPGSAVTILNGGALTVDANTTVNSINISGGGQLTLNTGMTLSATNFTINSDATNGTGTFVDLNPAGGLTVNGTTNVQQYLTSGRNWYVSSPVASAAASVVTGTAGNILYSYNEPDDTWLTTSPSFGVAKGYIANVASGGAITFTGGALNTGNLTSSPLTNSGTNFNLVGNPYPSYLNWEGVFANTNTLNVESTIWYRTQNGTGSYVFDTYNASGHVGTSNNGTAVTRYIAPMQAVWVKATDDISSLGFDNTMRTHLDQSITANRLKAPAVANTAQQMLRLQVSNGINTDEAIVLFNDNATDGYDSFDSQKKSNNNTAVPELYTFAGTKQVAINGLNSIKENEELPLGFTTGTSNTFTIKASEISNFGKDIQIILKDKVLNSEQELTTGTTYTFASDPVSTTSRFSILFKSVAITTGVDPNSVDKQSLLVFKNSNGLITITRGNSTGEGIVTISNATGQKLFNCPTTGTTTIIGKSFIPGAYLVSVNIAGYTITKKVIIQ